MTDSRFVMQNKLLLLFEKVIKIGRPIPFQYRFGTEAVLFISVEKGNPSRSAMGLENFPIEEINRSESQKN